MNLQLNKDELLALTESVTNTIRAELIRNALTDTIYKDAENMAEKIIKIHRPLLEVKCQSIELLTPILKDVLSKDNFLINVTKSVLNEMFSAKEFKQLSVDILRLKADQMEAEMWKDFENTNLENA